MNLPILAVSIVSAVLMFALPVAAATPEVQKPFAPAATKGTEMSPAAQKAPGAKVAERPKFTMTCPNANEVNLHISYVITSWSITPSIIQPAAFSRAYATIDSKDKSKVILACLYQMNADYTAKTAYNGKQKCYCNPTTGEGMISYKGMEGYTTNIAGTSAAGKIPVKKTGQKIQDKVLECQFHAGGDAQFFKVHKAMFKLSACQANGREVTCQ